MKKSLALFLIVSLMLLPELAHPAMAHPAADVARYVAESGLDQGTCHLPQAPCQTILYAVSQANKGDEIRVAEGTYFIHPSEADALLSTIVPVTGGYSLSDDFSRQDPIQNKTYVMGPDFTAREALFRRGIWLMQDAKAWWPLPQSIAKVQGLQASVQTLAFPCSNGSAGIFPCNGIDFLGQLPLDQFSSNPADANDVWGFVDLNNQREYAIIGLENGTAVVDVTNPSAPVEVGTIPGPVTIWRDMKVYQYFDANADRWRAYAYTVADQVTQGLQIIDLSDLPSSISLVATYTGFSAAHNIYLSDVNFATGTAMIEQPAHMYILGSDLGRGAFRILDLANPIAPVEVTSPPNIAQYAHDATTLVITDSRTDTCDAGHNPCELLVDFNENTIDIWDVTDKANPFQISTTPYANSAYTHSGWWTEDKQFVFVQDESDELRHGLSTTLRTLDISDLTKPIMSNVWSGPTQAIDHNGFVLGDRYYMSNYTRGMTVLDISNPNAPVEVAYFDTYPAHDTTSFFGAWGVYPYLPSGTILISDIQSGLILVRESRGSLYMPLISKTFKGSFLPEVVQ